MAELNYLNPASLMPSSQEMAGGEYASPFSRAFQASIQANRAMPFMQQALRGGDLAYQQANAEFQESQDPLAKAFRAQRYKSGIQELLMGEQIAKLKKVNMEALDLYPTATKALELYNNGDVEGAKNLYETYTKQRGDSEVPEQLRSFGEDALKVMTFAKNKVESDPDLVQKIAQITPELASREKTTKYTADKAADTSIAVANINKEASLAGIQAQLDKTDAGQFSRVVEKLNKGQDLDAGDRLLLSSKVTEEFSKSPGGKLLTQMSSLLLISGIKDTSKATELLTQLTKDTWKGFIKNLPETARGYLQDEIPNISAPIGGEANQPTPPGDLGPAPQGATEGQIFRKGTTTAIVKNGRMVKQ